MYHKYKLSLLSKIHIHSCTKSIVLIVVSSGFDFLIQRPGLFCPSYLTYLKNIEMFKNHNLKQ